MREYKKHGVFAIFIKQRKVMLTHQSIKWSGNEYS